VQNDKYRYREISKYMTHLGLNQLYIHYDDVKVFDPDLENLIRLFSSRIQYRIENAATMFFQELQIAHETPPTVKVCDVPRPNDFIPLIKFWKLLSNYPCRGCHILCIFPIENHQDNPCRKNKFF
jgi:hypothetical protein